MSLSVPYVLRAAYEEVPSLVLHPEGGNRIDVATAARLSHVEAATLWGLGYRPADCVDTADPVTQLAAARLGLVITSGRSTRPSHSPGEACDVHVVETLIWSQTTLSLTKRIALNHGDYLDVVRSGSVPDGLHPLTTLIRPILLTMEHSPHTA